MSWEAEEPEEPPGKRSRKAPSSARYALKVLCPDELTGQILGRGGKVKDQIQQESKAHLTFSRKADYFPNTYLRVLAIYADETWSLQLALEGIVEKLIECADQEHAKPALPGCELISKDPGEYIFRLCLPSKTSSVLIGTGGQNVKQLRAETGVKVVVEKDSFVGHQLVRVTGKPASIKAGLAKVNEYVQEGAGSEAYLEYSQLVNFSDAMDPQREEHEWFEPSWQPQSAPAAVAREAGAHKTIASPHGPSQAHANMTSNHRGAPPGMIIKNGMVIRNPAADASSQAQGGLPQGGAHAPVVVSPQGAPRPPIVVLRQEAPHLPVVVPPPSRQGNDAARSSRDPGVELLTEAVHSMPKGTADVPYSINFALPDAFQRTWHQWEEFQQYLEQTTGAKIEAEADAGPPRGNGGSPRQLSIVGPLMGIYAAHIMIMQKAMEVEREEREEAERRKQGGASNEAASSVQEMQAQVLELQKQLQEAKEAKEAAEALAAAAQGKSSGGGKGKCKGKSKSKKK